MGIYAPINVKVSTKEGELLPCRSYHVINKNAKDKRPSVTYLDVILRGATESNLPEDYVAKLRQIEHNGSQGSYGKGLLEPDVPLYK